MSHLHIPKNNNSKSTLADRLIRRGYAFSDCRDRGACLDHLGHQCSLLHAGHTDRAVRRITPELSRAMAEFCANPPHERWNGIQIAHGTPAAIYEWRSHHLNWLSIVETASSPDDFCESGAATYRVVSAFTCGGRDHFAGAHLVGCVRVGEPVFTVVVPYAYVLPEDADHERALAAAQLGAVKALGRDANAKISEAMDYALQAHFSEAGSHL